MTNTSSPVMVTSRAISWVYRTIELLWLVSMAMLLSGCGKQRSIALDDRNALSLAPDIQWAVVKEPYVTYRKDKSWDAPTGDYERKGKILQVLGTSDAGDGVVWLKFSGGYLPSSSVTIESNRYKAERTSQSMQE